jgi:hypothetical protein
VPSYAFEAGTVLIRPVQWVLLSLYSFLARCLQNWRQYYLFVWVKIIRKWNGFFVELRQMYCTICRTNSFWDTRIWISECYLLRDWSFVPNFMGTLLAVLICVQMLTILGPKWNAIVGGYRKLRNEHLHKLYWPRNSQMKDDDTGRFPNRREKQRQAGFSWWPLEYQDDDNTNHFLGNEMAWKGVNEWDWR